MSDFFKRFSLFVATLVALLMGSYHLNKIIFKNYGFKVPPSKQTLITGSSLVTNGINPDFIDNSCNVALAAEPICISYLKLKDLLSTSHSVENVILSFSLLESSSSRWDGVFRNRKQVSMEMFARVSFLKESPGVEFFEPFKPDKLAYYEVYIRNRVFPAIPLIIKALDLGSVSFPHIGGFIAEMPNRRERVIDDLDYSAISKKFFDSSRKSCDVSDINIMFLDSIVDLTYQKKVNLLLVGMPMHVELYNKIPKCNIAFYEEQKERLKKFQHVDFIDLSTYFKEHHFFSDYAHLNISGADSVAKILNNYLVQN